MTLTYKLKERKMDRYNLCTYHTDFFEGEVFPIVFQIMEDCEKFGMGKITNECFHPVEEIDFMQFYFQVDELIRDFNSGFLQKLLLVFGKNKILVLRDKE